MDPMTFVIFGILVILMLAVFFLALGGLSRILFPRLVHPSKRWW